MKTLINNIILNFKTNKGFRTLTGVIIVAILSIIYVIAVTSTDKNDQKEMVNISSSTTFPSYEVIDKNANPIIYDFYLGLLNKRINKDSDYTVVVSDGENALAYSIYYPTDDEEQGIISSSVNFIDENVEINTSLKKLSPVLVESYNDDTFYFYCLDQGFMPNTSVIETEDTKAPQFFYRFGYPYSWLLNYKSNLTYIDFNSSIIKDFNYKQLIYCPYDKENFNIDDPNTYILITVYDDGFYLDESEMIIGDEETTNSFLQNNNIEMTIKDCKQFSEEIVYPEYYLGEVYE